MATSITCERCGVEAGPDGIDCPICHRETCQGLLRRVEWRKMAKELPGDFPGETLYDSTLRQANAKI